MSKYIPDLSELSRNTFRTFETVSKSSAGFTQRPVAHAVQGWSEVTIAACRQARATLELSQGMATCRSPNEIAALQSAYLNETIESYLHAQSAFASLLFSPASVSDIETTRDALRLEPVILATPGAVDAGGHTSSNAGVATLTDLGERQEQPADVRDAGQEKVAA